MAKCGECTYLNISDGNSSGAFWCEKRLERHLATDIECGSFCRAYGRSSSSINNAIEYSNNHNSGGGCFLTTMICKLLKLDDNNIYLETMRKFRNNTLQKDEKYKSLLVEYDIIGPKIAKELEEDVIGEKIAIACFEKYIKPITTLITNEENESAINLYVDMTTTLKRIYNLDGFNISTLEIDNADIEKSGHGKYIQKKIAL